MNAQQAKALIEVLENIADDKTSSEKLYDEKDTINCFIDEWVIIRTYSAGNWFGKLERKVKNEIILKDARRMWRWKTNKGISLSDISLHGIDENESSICEAVPRVWIEAIEIIPVASTVVDNIKNTKAAKAS